MRAARPPARFALRADTPYRGSRQRRTGVPHPPSRVALAATESGPFRGDDMAKSSKTARKSAGTKKKTAVKTKRTANAAFMRPVQPDDAVAAVVGAKPIPRTEVTKRLWAYIKKNGLQDKKNKRMINADAALKVVFGGKASVNMFEMTKLVNKHLK
jgi:chromatin remodeling complex protein RSC6